LVYDNRIPAIVVVVYQFIHHVVARWVWFRAPALRVSFLVYPIIIPNINVTPLPNRPVAAFFEDPTSIKDAPPSVSHLLFGVALKKGVLW
jgi:hypothetical protein